MEAIGLFRGVAQFVAVAEELSYRKAAARLGVSAAALSKAVLALETELGVTLLQRTSRAVSLTTEGEAFLARCREAISSLRGAREEASSAKSAPQGELTISASFILTPLVTQAIALLAVRYPKLTFRLSATDRLARFAEEGVDAAVRVGPLYDSNLTAKRLRSTRWVTVAAPSYLARKGIPNQVEELAQHSCLRFITPNGRARPWAFPDKPELSLSGPFFVDHGPTLIEAALAGLGVIQVLDFMVQDYVTRGLLIEVLPSATTEGPPIHALCAKGRQKNANIKALFEGLAQIFGKTG